jgi:hypothetical protein
VTSPRRRRERWRAVACPACGAPARQACHTRGGGATAAHVARIAHGLRSVFATAAQPKDETDYLDGTVYPFPFEPADYTDR